MLAPLDGVEGLTVSSSEDQKGKDAENYYESAFFPSWHRLPKKKYVQNVRKQVNP